MEVEELVGREARRCWWKRLRRTVGRPLEVEVEVLDEAACRRSGILLFVWGNECHDKKEMLSWIWNESISCEEEMFVC